MKRTARLGIVVLHLFYALSAAADPGSKQDREALFDYLLEKTLARESFSPVKTERLGLDVEQAMRQFREELVDADTDEKLYYALVKISNARKDRHLTVSLVPGGIELDDTAGVALSNYPVPGADIPHAPVKLATDYAREDAYFLFVKDVAKDVQKHAVGHAPSPGDKVLRVNGQPISEYVQAIEPYHRYSTVNGFWWKLAEWLPQKSAQFPPEFYRERLELSMETTGGERYDTRLSYLPPDTISWAGHGDRRYPGFDLTFATETFDFYERYEGAKVLLVDWHGFRANLVPDVDRLIAYASERNLLDHAIIWDGTRSRGGSKGAYAVQRLSPHPFKTTFGNLRLSDITDDFIAEKRQQRAEARLLDGDATETVDDGAWLMDWLNDDVSKGLEAGQDYSNDVPFKLAHLPKYSDGVLHPAGVHFRGPLVCFFGPYGGSHLDQFASIIIDNDIGYTIGMSPGGYSNTWEWEEVLRFPTTGKPIVGYMWSIGHSIRPNGEILEGNPAEVLEPVPYTRDNFETYYDELLSRAYRHLGIE